MKTFWKILLVFAVLLSLAGCNVTPKEPEVKEDYFELWTADAPAVKALQEYMAAITDEKSPDYIPPEDRIAVFDMDGTVYGELFPTYLEYLMLEWRVLDDPTFTADEEMKAVGQEIRDGKETNTFASGMEMRHAIQAARAYAGMTPKQFAAFVYDFLLKPVEGFEGMLYGEAFFMPMVGLIDYLNDNEFKVYICSGSDRFICRALIEGNLEIAEEHIIGMDVQLEATNQGDTDGLNYVFSPSDDVIRTDKLLIKNLKMNKVAQIAQEIGRQPVLAFGNSSGDVSMCNYVASNNPYKSAVFMIVADDDVRDYGNPEKAAKLAEQWKEYGWNVISEKNDWLTIYGEGVTRTERPAAE